MLKQSQFTYFPSPAKLNLFLHVCGRLENGYHALESLFQIIDLCDEIGFKPNTSGEISIADDIPGVACQDNLMYKAAHTLLPYRKTNAGIDITINKRISIGGGLGGGSSNAATCLLVLNQFWECGLDIDALATMGLKLGADVPVFIRGLSAFARGVGEKLTPANLPATYYLVLTPNVHISTQSVFMHPDLPRNTPSIDFTDYEFSNTRNDCEKLVCEAHPEVANLLQWLLHYAPSRMTGTGASVFAMFDNLTQAQNAMDNIPAQTSGFIAQGLNRSPLQQRLLPTDQSKNPRA